MNFEPYAAFCRLDRNQDGFVTPLDLLNFMRENGYSSKVATEADCYYVVKFFDADEDGKLTYPEFLQMCLPCTNPKMRAATTQRPTRECRPGDYLSMDVEQDLARLLRSEVELHQETEALKQRLESSRDFAPDAAYKSVDYTNIGRIDIKCLDNFFKRMFAKNI